MPRFVGKPDCLTCKSWLNASFNHSYTTFWHLNGHPMRRPILNPMSNCFFTMHTGGWPLFRRIVVPWLASNLKPLGLVLGSVEPARVSPPPLPSHTNGWSWSTLSKCKYKRKYKHPGSPQKGAIWNHKSFWETIYPSENILSGGGRDVLLRSETMGLIAEATLGVPLP